MTHPLRWMPGLVVFCFVFSVLLAQGCGGKGDHAKGTSTAGIESARDGADLIPDTRAAVPDVDEIGIPPYDGTDDDDIVTNLRRLFHCPYEYQNGIIQLNYASGIELEKDVHARGCKVTGNPNERNLLFEGRAGVGGLAHRFEEGEELEEEDRWLEYSFAGNTHGQILLNCRFEDGVQIEFDVAYQLIIPNNPHFQVLINSDRRSRSYYATDWGTWLIDAEYKRATKTSHTLNSAIPRRPPNLWIDRFVPHHFKIRYSKKGEHADGRLRIWLDDVLTFDVKAANKYTGGFVGFRWHDVKFVVTRLSVKGRLDTDWAREALAKVGDDLGF